MSKRLFEQFIVRFGDNSDKNGEVIAEVNELCQKMVELVRTGGNTLDLAAATALACAVQHDIISPELAENGREAKDVEIAIRYHIMALVVSENAQLGESFEKSANLDTYKAMQIKFNDAMRAEAA